ncbi:MAG: alpha/beta hydrolase [Brevundimonas sp.]|jgi:arylformamidase|nr:alpha/beta hydrolase [Brevundimonas sp.]
MKRTLLLSLGLVALIGTSIAQAAPGDRLRERLRERMAERAAEDAKIPAARPDQMIAYGKDPMQGLNFWRAKGTRGPAPLIMFVHGGGWSKGSKDNATGRAKVTHYPDQGYAFASIDYRLVPNATVEQQAADVAAALKALLDRAGELGIDRGKVVLMGHSAGAHLVALVGTDPQYLRAVGLSHADVDGVIPLDGAAYDIPAQFADAGGRMAQIYTAAFGTEPARQKALSPISHAAEPNAGAFLFPHVDRADAVRQNEPLAAALRAARTPAETARVEGRGLIGHMEINRKLGEADYPATPIVDAWLKKLFGR